MNNQIIKSSSTQRSLTSTPDRFSEDAWNLILKSETEARKWRHEYLDVEHILQVLFTDRAFKSFVQALPINHADLLDRLEGFLSNQQINHQAKLL